MNKLQQQNGERGHKLLPQCVLILLALYDPERGQARSSMSAEEIAQAVNQKHDTRYRADCLARYARACSEEHRGQIGLPEEHHLIQVVGDNGSSRFILTPAGLEVARLEYQKQATSERPRADFTVMRGELCSTDMDRIASNLGYN